MPPAEAEDKNDEAVLDLDKDEEIAFSEIEVDRCFEYFVI
jgi:hypothetical protein